MARNQFGGFGGPNMQQLMRQAQKMQQQMEQAQAELDAKEYEASAGGGMVTCKINAVDPEDVEMLQDMIMAAVNEALKAGEENREKTMSALAPGGMGGMF